MDLLLQVSVILLLWHILWLRVLHGLLIDLLLLILDLWCLLIDYLLLRLYILDLLLLLAMVVCLRFIGNTIVSTMLYVIATKAVPIITILPVVLVTVKIVTVITGMGIWFVVIFIRARVQIGIRDHFLALPLEILIFFN